MNGRSPSGLPPSPAPSVIPGTMRSASASVVERVSSSNWRVSTVIARGVSIRSAVALSECCRSARKLPSSIAVSVTVTEPSCGGAGVLACAPDPPGAAASAGKAGANSPSTPIARPRGTHAGGTNGVLLRGGIGVEA